MRHNFVSFDVQIDLLVAKTDCLAFITEGEFFTAQNAAVKIERFL